MHYEDIYSRLRPPPLSSPRLREHELEGLDSQDLEDELEESVVAVRGSFLDALSPEEVTPVAEIMARNVFCATPDMSLDALAYIMLDQNISGAPVVDETGKPVGMVSKTDVLRELRELCEIEKATWRACAAASATRAERESDRSRRLSLELLEGRTALDAMTPIVYWLPEDGSISQAAALMAYERVHRIPIVNKNGKVVGVVSTLDILRWLACRKGYLIPR